jgi:nitrate/nitrite transporter NarK
VAIVGIVLVSRHSDRVMERRYHCAVMCLAAAAGLLMIGAGADRPLVAFLGLVIATTGVLSSMAPFWQIPNEMLAAMGMAGGIALINSVGNLSGWLGPFMVGWFKDLTGSTATGLYVVAGLEVLAALLTVLCIPRRSAVEADTLVVVPRTA